ncbi:type II toxin-antitoxin system HigA family antitoxin [Pseudomonas sp. SLFW]|uniref:helix-turn-helix domain-containing protein n=1 Tax=Pseudomonas sp. SLFW TaxID=2683259 RepID=UPI0014134E41|nr:helix-turn-helix domain-containing protein [Pseudomonas sp. SLFW]NBB10955.1 transcriptional regulator [Pseudomonas sp. SLFW]
MSALIKHATEHWHHVAPLLNKPETEDEYDLLVSGLDELLEIIGEDEGHPLNRLAILIGDAIEAYDHENRPMPVASGVEALRYLMREHGLNQGDVPEVGTQSVISEILSGKRQLNLRQVRQLADRFGVPVEVFI